MRYVKAPFTLAAILLAASIGASQLATVNVEAQQSATPAITAKEVDAGGLKTATFDTPNGKISVNLPDDMSASDTISGTVVAEAAGNTPEEKAKNEDEISGYVVEIAKAEEPPKPEEKKPKKKAPCANPKAPEFTCLIPPACAAISLILRSPTGKKVCETPMTCLPEPPKPACGKGECVMPTIGSCGRPVQLKGPCDGNFANSCVKIGDQVAKPLAESPRQQIVRSPKTVVGPTTIERREGTEVTRAKFTNVRVKLAAAKVGLQKGETTTITVQVEGLEGATGPVNLRIENRAPDVVDLSGGNTQVVKIDRRS